MDRIWDKFVTEQDKAVFQAAGYGKSIGYGKRPALVVIDVHYSFIGDERIREEVPHKLRQKRLGFR